MKKYFLTGLVILLPLALTIAIVVFIINLFTGPFVGFFVQQLQDFSWYKHYAPLIHALLKILLIVILFFFTVLLGFLTRALLFNSLLKLSDYVMHRIPLIRTIYKASQQVIKTLFESSSRSFKQVVLVPFPSQSSYAIGLISSATPAICETTRGLWGRFYWYALLPIHKLIFRGMACSIAKKR